MLFDSFKSNPEITEKLESEAFKYSEQIMAMRIMLELTPNEIAKYLNITPEQYIDYEYCELYIPVNKYKEMLTNLSLFLFTKDISKLVKLKNLLNKHNFRFTQIIDEHTISYENETECLILHKKDYWETLIIDEKNYKYEYKITEKNNNNYNDNTLQDYENSLLTNENISFNKFVNELNKTLK
jgi:hypothetical protein